MACNQATSQLLPKVEQQFHFPLCIPNNTIASEICALTIGHNRIQHYSQWNHIGDKQDEGTTYTREVLSGICAGMSVKPDINQQAAHTNAGTMDTSGVLHDTTTAPTTPATKNTPV
jgi:hypothetical protein